jgi:hypothetical protein
MSKITDYLLQVQNDQSHQWTQQFRAVLLIIFAVAVFVVLLVRFAM